MRIAYLHYLYGQDTALNHVWQFATAARGLGHQVDLYAMNLADHRTGNADLPLLARLRHALKERASRYLHEPKELLWNARYVGREIRLLGATPPDVMLVRDHLLTASCIPVARRLNLPLVLEMNSPAYESTRYFDEYAHIPGVGFATERFKVRRANQVVVVSKALRDYLIGTHQIPPDRIVVNPNGADPELFHPTVDGTEVRRRYHLQHDLVVGFVGSLHPWHGPELLRRIIETVARPGVRFLLVGAGPGWSGLQDWLANRPCGAHVVVAGRVAHEQVPAYVAAMDVTLIPDSNLYGSSLKVLEYMAAGRAVVAPRYEPFEEVVEHRRHAMLFPPRDLRSAVETIEALLRDAGLRVQLGRSARERVLGHLTWRHNAVRTLDACALAAQQRRAVEARAA